jgi:hypothetical protein
MHSFEVDDSTPERFVARVNRSLQDGGLASHVTARVEAGDIVARISWLGTTELRYRIQSTDRGFRADLQRQRVAALHGAFQSRFEERLEEILARVGARLL